MPTTGLDHPCECGSIDDLEWLSTLMDFAEPLRPPTGQRLGHEVPISIGIIGGGTAGYFAALAFSRHLPNAAITLIESPDILPIGVGEATVPSIQWFLHRFLGIDPVEFYREVRPTWKLGIHFEWGKPGPYHFQAPFDWKLNNIGLLGSLTSTETINDMTIGSVLMENDVTPLFVSGDSCVSLLHRLPFAYHFDVSRLLEFLQALVRRAKNITYRRENIAAVIPDRDGVNVTSVRTAAGLDLTFDLYVDSTGFRSLLLEKALHVPYISYADSLFTDRALVFNVANGCQPKPYTSAITMNAGWTWRIPQRDEDHCGYVHCSAACTPDEAVAEVEQTFPGATPQRTVHFRSGRHEDAWKGNVVAIGNSYAFVEPLESTGLLMLTQAVVGIIETVPTSHYDPTVKHLFNRKIAKWWDALRWFLAVHYKFNQRLHTDFWRTVRADVDVSGAEPVIAAFRGVAPLRFRERFTRFALMEAFEPVFYGLAGYDCILFGQGVASAVMESTEETSTWRARSTRASHVARRCGLTQAVALQLIDARPQVLLDTFTIDNSWLHWLPPS